MAPPVTKLKDRITPQVNFFQESEHKVAAGRGRQDRQGRWWMIDERKRCMWRGCVWKMMCDNGACGKVVCVCANKCHACHAKAKGSTTPATQNEGGCHQVPHLPRETKVDVTKCHACHAKCKWMSPSATPATQKWRGVSRDQGAPSASPDPAQSHKCHTCHVKRRWMSPSATCATQKWRGVNRDQGAPSASPDPAESH